MLANRTQDEVLQREFLTVRAKILEIAAALDRIDRANKKPAKGICPDGSRGNDQRLDQLHQALQVLQQPDAKRTEQVQLIFSREYNNHWQQEFGVTR